MQRLLAAVAIVTVFATSAAAQDKDTDNAQKTRKALQAKITVDFKDTALSEVLDDIKAEVRKKGGGTLTWRYDTGISRNRKLTYKGKDQTVAEVLEGLFAKEGLGYVVISKEKDTYDGSILIKQGKERGYPAGQEPKDKK